MRDYNYFVYIVTNKSKTLYIGVTNNLERRMYEHKHKMFKGFSEKYNINKLIHQEYFNNINEAIAREKQLKGWRREKKIKLINEFNSEWKDLSEGWFE